MKFGTGFFVVDADKQYICVVTKSSIEVSAKDIFHEAFKQALIDEGWVITHDPLTVKLSKRSLFIDLGAEKIIGAEKGSQKIAVEVKSFLGLSPLADFYDALGKYQLYFLALKKRMPERVLYLAMPEESYNTLINDELLQEFINDLGLRLVLFDPSNKNILSWIN
jgi:hypothetical protein